MQAVPVLYASVSELYSTDEVDLLLEEIKELEPTNCLGEEVQDLEIAGSGAEACGGGAEGGRSPAGTEHSWDSHAHYCRVPPLHPRPIAPLYCRTRHCVTSAGAAALFISLCSGAACCCIWSGVGLRAALLPLPARIQFLQLGAFSSLLVHSTILLMHVTQLALLLPFDWNKLALACSAWSVVSLWCGASLTLHAVLGEPAYRYTPPLLASLLLSAAGLGFAGGSFALLLMIEGGVSWRRSRPCRASSHPPTAAATGAATHAHVHYRALPFASTSRDNPL